MSNRTCHICGRPKLLDAFSGEGGAGVGYMRAGFCVDAVDKVPDRKTEKGQTARLANYPNDCPGARKICTDAVSYIAEHGHEYAAGHGSPTCTGYSRGTAAIADRLSRYDRLIGVTREAFLIADIPYVIENVFDARRELVNPIMLCGRMFGLTAIDTDGTPLTLDRHRLFESNVYLEPAQHAEHPLVFTHDKRKAHYGKLDQDTSFVQVTGGGNCSIANARDALGIDWMNKHELNESLPPAYTEWIGRQLLEHIDAEVVAA